MSAFAKRKFVLFSWVLFASLGISSELDILWSKGLEASQHREWDQAYQAFSTWRDHAKQNDIVSADLYFNMSLLAHRRGKKALASYHAYQSIASESSPLNAWRTFKELGKQINSDDNEKESSLATNWRSGRLFIRTDWMAFILLISSWVLILCFLIYRMKGQRSFRTVCLIGVLPLILFVLTSVGLLIQPRLLPLAVLISESPIIKVFPNRLVNETQTSLPAGTLVTFKYSLDSRIEVVAPLRGWVEVSSVKPLY